MKLIVYTILLSFVLLSSFFCTSPATNKNPALQYASLSDSTHYVGIETCAGCHRDIYETFIETGMGKSFDFASRKKSSAEFSDHSMIKDDIKKFQYHPYWNHDSLKLKEFRLNGKDTVYKREENIRYIVGSGQHTNSHMIDVNGYLYQAPATFYTQKGLWDLPPGFEHGANSRFGRKIELECMSCHNAYPRMEKGSENKYTFVANGIDCERCHGPGSKHVEEKRKGNLVDITQQIDYSIVNPAKLPVALQLDICQRCHIQGNAVLAEGKSFFDFKPAMHLSDVMNVYMPVYKGQENEHIMASHAERMQMSRCFIVSLQKAETLNQKEPSLRPYKNAMTCVTCHNPHVSVKVTENDVFNNACKNCHHNASESHPDFAAGDSGLITCSADMRARTAVKDNCVSCHMPKNSTIDIPHVSTTDHFIRKPLPPSKVNSIREFIGIACINNSHDDEVTRGKAYLSYYEKFEHQRVYLDSAKKYLSDNTLQEIKSNFKSLIHWAYLREDYNKEIEYAAKAGDVLTYLTKKDYTNEDAWTAYRIGEAFSQTSRDNLALSYFEKAVELAPYIPEFRNKLGTCQVTNRLFGEAKKNFEFLLKENPEYAEAYINLGYLTLTVFQNLEAADLLYDKALALDPDNIQALINKAGTQVFLHKPGEARRFLQRVLVQDPANLRAKQLLHAL